MDLSERELLTTLITTTDSWVVPPPWRIEREKTSASNVLSDDAGRDLIRRHLADYRGQAAQIEFGLALTPGVWADYYSLHDGVASWIDLGLRAVRHHGTGSERIVVKLPMWATPIPFPSALTAATEHQLPIALLMPVSHDIHLLFANHIALASDLARRFRRSPAALVRGWCSRRRVPMKQRISLAFRAIDPSADIHPTAVVEGSVIGPRCRVGAHAVVRYSRLGADVRLHDGATVEWSVIGDRTWLMHGLTVYRCVVERDCFLIHGPYQFSSFQAGSAAFATIMMDYRPDGRPIRVEFPGGVRLYQGRFLGALLQPGAKTLGGCLVGPGRIVAPGQWLGVPADAIHLRDIPSTLGVGLAMSPMDLPKRDAPVQA